MTAARLHPRLVLGGSIALLLLTFAGVVYLESPGLGIGHFFYLPIALLAIAHGPRIGAAAGMTAAAFYTFAVIVNNNLPTPELLTISSPIRFTTFVVCGFIVGWFARKNEELIDQLELLAKRDRLTGLPNARAFEAAVDRRFATNAPFAILLGDLDGLRAANEQGGHGGGDELLVRLSEALGRLVRPGEDIARVGGDEFAILASVRGKDEAAERANLLERRLVELGFDVTFGWGAFPEEGTNALGLVRVADERLYARKLVRGGRTVVPQQPRIVA